MWALSQLHEDLHGEYSDSSLEIVTIIPDECKLSLYKFSKVILDSQSSYNYKIKH